MIFLDRRRICKIKRIENFTKKDGETVLDLVNYYVCVLKGKKYRRLVVVGSFK